MNDEQLKKKIEAGFDPEKYDDYIRVMILLLDTVEYFNNEMIDYLDSYRMRAFNIKEQITGIEHRLKNVQKAVRHVLVDTPENTQLYLSEWERFKNNIEKYISADSTAKTN